jgi:hypothetical protein
MGRKISFSAPAALSAIAVLAGAPSAPAAGPPVLELAPPAIEGVWSFNGGKVAIEHVGGGWQGTVVSPTRFAECTHQVGEAMWTQMRLQPDGSFYGYHRWFFEGDSCTPNPEPGPTAWRLLRAPDGLQFLRVCFSEPGKSQPQISPTGVAGDDSYGCVDSSLLAPPPATSGVAAFNRAVSLPSTRSCLSRRVFTIHLRDPRNDPIREALVELGSKRLRVQRHRGVLASRIDLRGLPKGTFTVRIRLVTVLGHRLSGSRRFHTCVPGPPAHRRR